MIIVKSQKPQRKHKVKAAEKREELRELLWPESEQLLWTAKGTAGYTTVPRLMPLILHLIRLLSKKGDPSSVYFELWARAFGEGIVSINDESICAYAAGYEGTRAVRSWRERILRLKELGFIDVKPQGNREIAHVLIFNPLAVCAKLRAQPSSNVPDEWWTAFAHRASEIGAEIPHV